MRINLPRRQYKVRRGDRQRQNPKMVLKQTPSYKKQKGKEASKRDQGGGNWRAKSGAMDTREK